MTPPHPRLPQADFDNADALLVSEVKMLLEHRKAQHESQDDDQDLSEVSVQLLPRGQD